MSVTGKIIEYVFIINITLWMNYLCQETSSSIDEAIRIVFREPNEKSNVVSMLIIQQVLPVFQIADDFKPTE